MRLEPENTKGAMVMAIAPFLRLDHALNSRPGIFRLRPHASSPCPQLALATILASGCGLPR